MSTKRPKPPWWRRWGIRLGLAVVVAASTWFLEWAAPFRLGLPSVLLFLAPLVIVWSGARMADDAATEARRRRIVRVRTAQLAAVLVLAVPVGFLQGIAGVPLWVSAAGIPSRAYAQFITVPGMTLDGSAGYEWASRERQLNAYYDDPAYDSGFWPEWGAIETVRSGRSAPCASLWYPSEDDAESPDICERIGPDLWKITPANDDVEVAFVRRTDGVTVALAGESSDQAALRKAVMNAREANDNEIWPLTVFGTGASTEKPVANRWTWILYLLLA